MKPKLFKFNEIVDTLEWVLEDAQEFVNGLEVVPDKLCSEPVAFQGQYHYIVFWEKGNCPSRYEVKRMLLNEGVHLENIYDLTQTDLVV